MARPEPPDGDPIGEVLACFVVVFAVDNPDADDHTAALAGDDRVAFDDLVCELPAGARRVCGGPFTLLVFRESGKDVLLRLVGRQVAELRPPDRRLPGIAVSLPSIGTAPRRVDPGASDAPQVAAELFVPGALRRGGHGDGLGVKPFRGLFSVEREVQKHRCAVDVGERLELLAAPLANLLEQLRVERGGVTFVWSTVGESEGFAV